MDMPVVAAARLEGHVIHGNLLRGNRVQITLSDKILCIRRVRFANGEHDLLLELFFVCHSRCRSRRFRIHFLRHVERRPGFRPAGIETQLGNDFRHLRLGNPVILRRLDMILQRTVNNTAAYQAGNGYDAAVVQGKHVVLRPDFPK